MALTGGGDGGLTPDAGTIFVNVNGSVMSLPWQAGSTGSGLASQIAQQLATASFLTVNYSSGSLTVGLTSAQPGSAMNWPISCSATDAYGQVASFTVSCPGMSGGTNTMPPTYQYAVGGYDGVGNLLSVTDSVMGTWNYNYDSLNRLISAQAGPNPGTGFAPYGAAVLTWGYDSFGNYGGETLSGSTSFAMPQVNYGYSGQNLQNGVFTGLLNNRIDYVNYDAAGNVITDIAGNNYTYDAGNRVLAVGGTSYIYDAEGNRVVKLSAGGVTNQYLLGLGGEQVAELDGNQTWQRTYVYGAGKQLAKYDPDGVHFDFTDWLGTRRMQGGAASGTIEETCTSLPFGDSLQCFGANGLPNGDQYGHHFTGKERDTESGLDYFGARYYGSSMGRWMSPDPSNWGVDFYNPQTWNHYSYVGNNPLSNTDPNGLWLTPTHNSIIDNALPGLSKEQRQILKDSSKEVDTHQGQEDQYMHGMDSSHDNVWEGAYNPEIGPYDYIQQNEHDAKEIQAEWIASGHTGIAPAALAAFGNAAHTITDEYSPSHTGFQKVHWYSYPWHWREGLAMIGAYKNSRKSAEAAVRAEFFNVFGSDLGQKATHEKVTVTIHFDPNQKLPDQ